MQTTEQLVVTGFEIQGFRQPTGGRVVRFNAWIGAHGLWSLGPTASLRSNTLSNIAVELIYKVPREYVSNSSFPFTKIWRMRPGVSPHSAVIIVLAVPE